MSSLSISPIDDSTITTAPIFSEDRESSPQQYTAGQRVANIKEVLKYILSDQTPVQLVNCCLVSHTFKETAVPILWRRFAISGRPLSKFFEQSLRANNNPAELFRYTKALTIRHHKCGCFCHHCELLKRPQVDDGSTTHDPSTAVPVDAISQFCSCEESDHALLRLFAKVDTLVYTQHPLGGFRDDGCGGCELFERLCQNTHLVLRIGQRFPICESRRITPRSLTIVFDSTRPQPVFIDSELRSSCSAYIAWFDAIENVNIPITIVLMPTQSQNCPAPYYDERRRKVDHELNSSVLILGHVLQEIYDHDNQLGRPMIQVFDLQPRDLDSRVRLRKATRERFFDEVLWFPRQTKEHLLAWFNGAIQWCGPQKFLDLNWDDVFELEEQREMVRTLKESGTDYLREVDIASDWHEAAMEGEAEYKPWFTIDYDDVEVCEMYDYDEENLPA